MNSRAEQNRQLRALIIVILASTIAAVAVMFLPAAMLGNFSRATGLSGVSGDAGRALFAFGAGALTLTITALVLLRRDTEPGFPGRYAAGIPETDDDLVPTWKERVTGLRLPVLKLPQMPWVDGNQGLPQVDDLPKLRNGDIHPDAPPRYPILASQDLPAPTAAPAVIEPNAATTAGQSLVAEGPPDSQLSLAEMVAQLEASVAQRHQQLVDLEIVAASLATNSTQRCAFSEIPSPRVQALDPDPTHAGHPFRLRPVLEAVPVSPPLEDDMDAALAAALATLHRMNGTGG